jgi:hypothetical protein
MNPLALSFPPRRPASDARHNNAGVGWRTAPSTGRARRGVRLTIPIRLGALWQLAIARRAPSPKTQPNQPLRIAHDCASARHKEALSEIAHPGDTQCRNTGGTDPAMGSRSVKAGPGFAQISAA